MIWLSPWALLGAIGVVLPTLIHLLGRGHATRRRFPSLRFLAPSRLLPTQRNRLHDPWLLLVRALIVALAATALARPLFRAAQRSRASDRGVARVAIVDTSRASAGSRVGARSAVDVARDSARTLVGAAQAGVIVETARPRDALRAAANWLARQGRRSEIVVYSTFPAGSLDSTDLASVPSRVGVALARIGVPLVDTVARMIETRGEIVASVSFNGRVTSAQWRSAGGGGEGLPRLLVGANDSTSLRALEAVRGRVPIALTLDTSRHVAIVFPSAADRARLDSESSAVRTPWMIDLLARLDDEQQRVPAAEGPLDGRTALLFFPRSAPTSVESARLVAAVAHASGGNEVEGRGAEPIPASQLTQWSRAASATDERTIALPEDGRSDARWVWGVVLVLLALELRLRRAARDKPAVDSEVPARAA